MEKKKVIRIIGNIGSGKTTLAQKILEKKPDFGAVWEPVEDNPLLPLFYNNPKLWAASIQTFMETTYYQRVKQCEQNQIVTDYGITAVFTKVLKQDGFLDYTQYLALAEMMSIYSGLGPKTIFVFLDVDYMECARRMQQRGRECEKNIEIEYFKKLGIEYQNFYKSLHGRINKTIIHLPGGEYDDSEIKKIIGLL